MDKNRFEDYLVLIDHLLDCSPGEESKILNVHQDLVDETLVHVMESVAFKMPEILPDYNQSNTSYLFYIAAQISFSITPVEYREFFENALNTTWQNSGNLKVVYSLLEQNLDKLNNRLARLIQDWRVCILPNLPQEDRDYAAGTVSDLGKLMLELSKGMPDENLEIAIASFTAAQSILTRDSHPKLWALIENNLGIVYGKKVYSEGKINKSENLEMAISRSVER